MNQLESTSIIISTSILNHILRPTLSHILLLAVRSSRTSSFITPPSLAGRRGSLAGARSEGYSRRECSQRSCMMSGSLICIFGCCPWNDSRWPVTSWHSYRPSSRSVSWRSRGLRSTRQEPGAPLSPVHHHNPPSRSRLSLLASTVFIHHQTRQVTSPLPSPSELHTRYYDHNYHGCHSSLDHHAPSSASVEDGHPREPHPSFENS